MLNLKLFFKTTLSVFTLLIAFQSQSQNLLESEAFGRYAYVYKITDQQAKTFFEEEKPEYNTSYFEKLVDSFPAKSEYRKILKQGYYLKVKIIENKVEMALTTVQDFNLFIFNNDKDLNIRVLDLKGKPIENAKIKLKNKRIPFDSKTQTYSLDKNYKDGIISLEYNGHKFFYNLQKSDKRSFLNRKFISVAYGTPVKYVWKPVKFVIDLPIDAYKTIKQGYGTFGTINQIERFAVNLYESVACLFDDYYCDDPKTFGYSITDKPKYRPKDSVKFKAFLLNKKFKAIKKPLDIYLSKNYRESKKLGQIIPYADGGYTFDFKLTDSLNLKLDKRYSLVLKDKAMNEYDRVYFYYEDYTLKGNTAKITSKTETQYKGDSLAIFIEAKDENDLNLMDAKLQLVLKPTGDFKTFAKQIFIPDTFWKIDKKLKPRGKTKINIPPDIFPKANLDYEVIAKINTSDNEVTLTEKRLSYVYNIKEIESELSGDTLQLSLTKNGKISSTKGNFYIKDNFDNVDSLIGVDLPYKHKINPYFKSYKVVVDSLEKVTHLKDHPDNISFNKKRTLDSIIIDVSNPKKLNLLYHVYKINKQIDEGQTSSDINLKYAVNSKKNYFFSLSYIWAGEVIEKNFQIHLNESQLNLEVTQPSLIYPGKKDTINIQVTDYKNEPVENVDLSAYGLTKKFDYKAPQLPNLQKYRKQKKIINNFSFKNDAYKLNDYELNIDEWEKKARLDSIIYYDFMYPRGVFETSISAENDITQFAPFVMKEGMQEDVKVIYVENNPVYTSWNEHFQSYSFPIGFGYHDIKLRTQEYEYKIDSIYFPMYRKTILSIDAESNSEKVKSRYLGTELTALEKRQLYPRVLFYNEHDKNFLAYINTDDRFFLIDKPENGYYNNSTPKITGPIYRDFQFRTYDSLAFDLIHESGFSYTFFPEYVKLKSYDNDQLPKYFSKKNQPQSLNDKVLTKDLIQKIWKQKILNRRKNNNYQKFPYSTSKGFATLKLIDTKPNPDKYVINTIIVDKERDDFRLYSGYQDEFFELKPQTHRVIFLFQDMTYQVLEDINIKANGLNIMKFTQPEEYLIDFMSSTFNEILNDAQLDINSQMRYREHLNRLKEAYNKSEKYFGPGNFVSGVVTDSDGLPLPGVNVIIKGTTIGTQTDFDGRYILKVPSNSKIVFSYIGFITKEISPSQNLNVSLEESMEALDEVVVTAYGTSERKAISSAVVSFDNNPNSISFDNSNVTFYFENPNMDVLQSLQGQFAGININNSSGNPGSGAFVKIRGVGSINANKSPLFVVDGVPLTEDQYLNIAQDNIGSISILKDAAATAIYGSRGANGVVIIKTKTGVADLQGKNPLDLESDFYAENSMASSIRNNFSDVAYWQPKLRTNENGEASFVVTYPDDITSWQTIVLAMNEKRQSGSYQSFVKAYKPVSARLYTPKFLVEGDQAKAIGKSLNYTQDTLDITTSLEVNGKQIFIKDKVSSNAKIDTLNITAKQDTLQLTYKLTQKNSDYFDGEKRNIPVFKKGVELQKGIFKILEPGDTLKHDFDKIFGEVELYAESNLLELIQKDIQAVANYAYDCNEQLASKLQVLLSKKEIYTYLNKDFKDDKLIKKIIKKLHKNKKDNGLWGWWKSSQDTSYWISHHVIKALLKAEKMGFKTKFEKESAVIYLKNQHYETKNISVKTDIILTLSLLGESVYPNVLRSMKENIQDPKINFYEKLKLSLALYNLNVIPDIKFLDNYKKEDIFDNIFYETKQKYTPFRVYQNNIQNTLMAYKLIKSIDSTDKRLPKIRHYLVSSRQNNMLINTYEITNVLEEILPDILSQKSTTEPQAALQINDKNQSDFPYQSTLKPDKLTLTNTGDLPIYVTSYQNYWQTQPEIKKDDFEIFTTFKNKSNTIIANGEEVVLRVDLKVNKEAEYVLLNIPIPGGFDYTSKPVQYDLEDHREYFKHKTSIFCSLLKAGTYSFEIPLIAKFSGKFNLNPTKIALMYFPTFYAHEGLKEVEVH